MCLWGLLFYLQPVWGQNLVPNPGFEAYSMCPPYPGQVHLAPPWDSPNNKTTDFFHRCSPSSAGVPDNLLGTQQPFRGSGYLGLRVWIPVITGNPPYREYATAPLLEPLQAGQHYAVTFWISMAERSSHLSDGLGLWFSAEYPDSDSVYVLEADIRHPTGKAIQSVEEWVPIRGIYQARGEERWLTIGNFLSDDTMVRERVRPGEQPAVYYYLDEVSVTPCGPVPSDPLIDTFLCPGDPLLFQADTNAWSVRWDNGSMLRQRLVTQPGLYSLSVDYGCYRQEWTFRVTGLNCSCRISQQNPSGQPSSWVFPEALTSFSIRVFDARGRFLGVFSRPDFLAFAKNLPSGMYYYQADLECGLSRGPSPQSGQFAIVKP